MFATVVMEIVAQCKTDQRKQFEYYSVQYFYTKLVNSKPVNSNYNILKVRYRPKQLQQGKVYLSFDRKKNPAQVKQLLAFTDFQRFKSVSLSA